MLIMCSMILKRDIQHTWPVLSQCVFAFVNIDCQYGHVRAYVFSIAHMTIAHTTPAERIIGLALEPFCIRGQVS